jgi:hypothetical protein
MVKGNIKNILDNKVDKKVEKVLELKLCLLLLLDRLIDVIKSKSHCRDKKECDIKEVMRDLHSINGITICDNFHSFSSELFCLRSKREDHDSKLKWLKKMYK